MNNEKKRFRFNVIDVLVILLLVALVAVLVIKRGAVQKQAADESSVGAAPISGQCEEPNVRFSVLSEAMEPELADAVVATVEEANRINNAGRLQEGYITDCEIGAPDEEGLVRIRFDVECTVNWGEYYTIVDGNHSPNLGGQDLRVGKAYTLKTMRLEVPSTIIGLEVLE